MAKQYQLRSQQDIDDGEYAVLPGTSSGDFVTHNLTFLKSKIGPGREIPGCHPSRWIYELINNNFTTCDLFERAKQANLDSHYGWQHPHRLMINGNQSFAANSGRSLSAVCLDCRFHFVFKMAWEEPLADQMCSKSQARWPLRDSQFPWHHLVWAGSDSDSNITADRSKYYPLLARENFACSAPPCTFQLTLEISEPRMPSWWVNLLLDHEAIRETLKTAKESEPARYEAATSDWAYQAPLNLNTYLKNILELPGEDGIRSISKRNKRFAVLFGPRCFTMFRQLEFTETVEDREGVEEGSFTPKFPELPMGPSNTTEIDTYRAFLEDVRAEVQSIIHNKGGQAAELCTPVLHEILQSSEVGGLDGDALVDIHRYKLLGVLPNQPKEVVVNAYKRQWELMPGKRKELVEALMGVANDLNDEQLTDYAMTQSSVFESQLQRQTTNDDDGLVPQALNFLGLQPPNNHSADALVNAFRQKLAQDPADAGTARSMLLLIAQASTDEIYRTTLLMETEGKMSLATSKVVLGLVGSTAFGPETLESAKKKIESSTSKDAKVTYLDAMEAIAEHYNAKDLKWMVQELRQVNGIPVPAGAVSSVDRPVNYELPVGLENIGNTCYLNSLLQYLFTVKPVRDIALDYDSFKLGLDDEKINHRLLGGNKMQMDRGEAVVAQAFAQELSDLFNNLQTVDKVATRPSQRLANAVLLSTHTLLNDSKSAAESSVSAKPPPLPTRPSPAPPVTEDVDMVTVTVNPASDPIEIASSASSQTLVDQADDSDQGFEKVEKSREASNTQVIEIGEELHDEGKPAAPSEPASVVIDLDGVQDALSQDTDVKMVDVEDDQTVDQKVLSALEHQKRSSGTDQQDVEEVMGSILNRLQAAIKPSSVDEKTGIQLEQIMETFFVTTVNYTKKFEDSNYQQEVSFDRSITAFPAPEGTCSLYDALGRNFDQQIIEESKLSRYTAIKTLPPVLHVLIQRSQSMGSKNGNPVAIPETLYLDRYMDAPHDSPEFRQRVENWMIAKRISDIKEMKTSVESNPPTGDFLDAFDQGDVSMKTDGAQPESRGATDDAMAEENWDFDGPMDEGFQLINPVRDPDTEAHEAATKPTDMQALETSIRQAMNRELKYREEALEKHNSGMKNIPYRLHAVICHRGQLMSGHYWVWIHDFEANVWRKYNDSNVDTNPSTEDVLKTLSTSGEPYFLCYVRDSDKEEYVNVPRRRAPPPPVAEDQPNAQNVEDATEVELIPDIDGDVKPVDVEPQSEAPSDVKQDELPPYSETPAGQNGQPQSPPTL